MTASEYFNYLVGQGWGHREARTEVAMCMLYNCLPNKAERDKRNTNADTAGK
jgi:hypothetical protein